MTKRMTSQTQAGRPHARLALLPCVTAIFAATLLGGCSSDSTTPPPKDAAVDRAKDTVSTPTDVGNDTATDSANLDVAIDAGGCFTNGQMYSVGATISVPVAGDCPLTCKCLGTGNVGQCVTSCPLDGPVIDNRPPADAPTDFPITCTKAGRTYNPGDSVPIGDGCGGSCVCLTTGVVGQCVGACPLDTGLDLPKDVPPVDVQPIDTAHDVTPPIDTSCVTGAACSLTNGSKGFCAAGACTACAGATDDAKCKTAYGTGNICLAGVCTAGDCHDSTGCADGRLCGSSVAHACGDCTTDAQCTGDTHYGAGYLCDNHLCVQGDCHDSAGCTGTKAGQVCGATTAHTCGACTSDAQCKNDTTYATKPICTKTTGLTNTGKCVSNNSGDICSVNRAVCPANSGDFCCALKCVPGNCCDDADCTTYGANFNCRQNTCTQCNAVTGTPLNYLVDPVDGDDTGATGSGMSGTSTAAGCRFHTIRHALAVIAGLGATAPAGTTITIVGRTGNTALDDVGENPPIQVPDNVTITTMTGPVSLTLATGDTAGFQLIGNSSGIQPATGAALTINGANHGVGIAVTAGSATIGNTTVTNAGGDGIQVKGGTASILAGVSVTGASATGLNISAGTTTISAGISVANAGTNGITISGGTATLAGGVSVTNAGTNGINVSGGTATIGASVTVTGAHANGINISGAGAATIGAGVNVTGSGTTANPANGLNISGTGSATITVGTGATSTAFDGNTQYGIAVADTGVLTIAGAAATTGVRTVSAKNNTKSNVSFTSTSATQSVISNFYSSGSGVDGMQIAAGSRIQVRHSVFRTNAGNGIHIIAGSTEVLSAIDLGAGATAATDPGSNELQSGTSTPATKNTGAGLCVEMALTANRTLAAEGNQFAGVDCVTNPRALVKNATCLAGADLGLKTTSTGGNFAVTVNAQGCTYTP